MISEFLPPRVNTSHITMKDSTEAFLFSSHNTLSASTDVTQEPADVGRNDLQAMYTFTLEVLPPPAEMAVTLMLILLGLFGNSMNLAILVPKVDNAVMLCLSALAGYDLVSCIAMGATVVYSLMGSLTSSFGYAWFQTYIIFPIILTAPYMSSCVTCIICIARYIMVKFPTKARVYCTTKVARYIILCITVLVALARLPVIWKSVMIRSGPVIGRPGSYKHQQFWSMWYFSNAGQGTWFGVAIVFDIALCVILILFSILMLVTYIQFKNKISPMTATKKDVNQRKMIQMVLCIVILCSICMAPKSLVRLLSQSSHANYLRSNYVLLAVTKNLYIMNYSINFYMYMVNHKWSRVEARKILARICKPGAVNLIVPHNGGGGLGSNARPMPEQHGKAPLPKDTMVLKDLELRNNNLSTQQTMNTREVDSQQSTREGKVDTQQSTKKGNVDTQQSTWEAMWPPSRTPEKATWTPRRTPGKTMWIPITAPRKAMWTPSRAPIKTHIP